MSRWYVGATFAHSHKVFDAEDDLKVCDCGESDDGRERARRIVAAHAAVDSVLADMNALSSRNLGIQDLSHLTQRLVRACFSNDAEAKRG